MVVLPLLGPARQRPAGARAGLWLTTADVRLPRRRAHRRGRRLAADGALRERMAALGQRIRASDGLRRGADVIESVARAHPAR
jgi:hypothetical protein